jgi:hypothetical protein
MIEGSESACERSAERKSEELMGAGNEARMRITLRAIKTIRVF